MYSRFCTVRSHAAKPRDQTREQVKHTQISLPFLLACTDPRIGPVDEVILTRETEQDISLATHQRTSELPGVDYSTIDPSLLFLSFVDPAFVSDWDEDSQVHENGVTISTSAQHDDDDAGLHNRIDSLQNQMERIAQADSQLSSFVGTSAWTNFFSAGHFARCIDVFFKRPQLLAMLVHQPSFQAGEVNLALLLAIGITGSAYIRYREQTSDSASFTLAMRDLAEKFIFHHIEKVLASTDRSASKRTLQICQAAYIITTLQSCVKDGEVRRRVVTRCHPMLVSALRHCGVIGARHDFDCSRVGWQNFVHVESSIRLLHWTWINDAWFTLLTNHPPAMNLIDMSGPFSCDDQLWRAECALSFDALIRFREGTTEKTSLKELVGRLLAEKWTESTVASFAELEVKHLLVVVLCQWLHSMLEIY